MSAAFEKFIRGKIMRITQPSISIRKNGTMGVNAVCVDKYFGECRYIEYYYDRDGKRIGLKPVKTKTEECYPVFFSKRSKSGTIAARKFFEYYGIDYKSGTKRYEVHWDDENKFIVADLGKDLEGK